MTRDAKTWNEANAIRLGMIARHTGAGFTAEATELEPSILGGWTFRLRHACDIWDIVEIPMAPSAATMCDFCGRWGHGWEQHAEARSDVQRHRPHAMTD